MNSIAYLSFILIITAAEFSADGLEYASPPSSFQEFVPFPKIIWSFWNQGLDNVKTFTKLCMNNMNHFAKVSGYEYRFLTDQNYTQFLSPQSNIRITNIINEMGKTGNPGKADIIRAFLMYQHGGIWMDSHSYFLQDLTWVQNLYKVPGVYNRFFPNPSVLLFTQNKKYSGNKTKIYDQKLQQQVYLFPGMENWAIIAKPRSDFFTDVVSALERYFQVGRAQIMEQSKKKGIKFGNERSQYLQKGNFQYQYVLQKKQKQLDIMKEPPTKYAVQYYKIWFMNSEYTAFIFRSYFQIDVETSLPFQYSQQMLGKLYEFQVRPYFIKNSAKKVNKYEGLLKSNGIKSNYQDVPNFIRPQSLVYTCLINVTSMFKEIDNLKQIFSFFQGNHNSLAQSVVNIKKKFNLIKKTIFGTLLSIPIVTLIWFLQIKIQKYSHIQLVS